MDRNEHIDLAGLSQYGSVLQWWRDTMIEFFQQQGRGDLCVQNGQLVVKRPRVKFATNYPCKYAGTEKATVDDAESR